MPRLRDARSTKVGDNDLSKPVHRALKQAIDLKETFTKESEARKCLLLDAIAKAKFRRQDELTLFHELLCFQRAYPDGPILLEKVETLLAGFGRRSDVQRLAGKLSGSGIAGTDVDYAFYWPTARWLAKRWPEHLSIRWSDFDNAERLVAWLKVILPYSDRACTDESALEPDELIEALKHPSETDATFLVRRFERLQCSEVTRERVYDDLLIPMSLSAGDETPSRTRARQKGSPVVFRTEPRPRGRPDLQRIRKRAPKQVTRLSARKGRAVIELAREAMMTRQRDLDAIAYANPNDVSMVDCEAGLQFAWVGALPKRRHILETVYVFITLMNGVPTGYVQACAMFGFAEINYNVFETFRGADAGWVYGWVISSVCHLMRSTAIVIHPYQLGGDGNEEAVRSGAWWFYYKMGFRPRDPAMSRLAKREARRVKNNPNYRTSHATLRELGEAEMYLYFDDVRNQILSAIPLDVIGERASRNLTTRFGADRESAIDRCLSETMERLDLRTTQELTRDELEAWRRLAPIISALEGVERWTARQKADLREVIRLKGSHHELDYLHRFDRHKRLRRGLLALARV